MLEVRDRINPFIVILGVIVSVVAFPKVSSFGSNIIFSKNYAIGKWATDPGFFSVWQVTLPASNTVTVPTEILLGANSCGRIGKKLELVS